tara:strand:+ start:1020 stop:1544 length:525 start_codon:yes stop_codon:yes gene_type:complete
MSSIFRIPEGENLVTFYMLPLVNVNKSSFGLQFKNSYIDKFGHKVYVELKKNMYNPIYKISPCYSSEMIIGNIKFIQFVMPSGFLSDSEYFIKGRYSKMSKEAKKIIFNTSTLPYNATMGSFSVSHPVLQALDKTITLRTFLSSTIGFELDEHTELISSPEENWFIEHRIKNLK